MARFSENEDAYGPGAAEDFQIPEPQASVQKGFVSMDEVLGEMEAEQRAAIDEAAAKVTLMNEARRRFAKAELYQQIIEGQLFEGDDEITLAVEDEFKAFAEDQMAELLGIKSAPKKAESVFEEDEITALKMLAARLTGKDVAIPKPAAKAPGKLSAPKPAAPAPAPAQLAVPKRGRGRPPGTGKNQRAAAAAAQQPAQRAQPIRNDPPATPTENGKMQVQLPGGKVVEVSKPTNFVKAPTEVKPLPMPSPDQMVALAMAAGEQAARDGDPARKIMQGVANGTL